MLKKISILFLALSIFSCKHDNQTIENQKKRGGVGAIVVFSSLQEGRGTVVASVDGVEIKSGDRVAKGKIVSFNATPESNRYVIRKWQGASYDESSIDEALLKIKDEKATYTVRVDFGNVVNFMRINSGEVAGSPVVPDIKKEELENIIKEKPEIKVKGANVTIVVASTDVTWDQGGFKVNGEEKQVQAYGQYRSAGVVIFSDLEIGKPFEVECSHSVKSQVFSFKFTLLREEGLVDVPRVILAIDDKKPEPMTETTLQELSNGTKPHFYSLKDPEIEISSSMDVIKEVILQEAGGTPRTALPVMQKMPIGKKYFTRFYVDNIPLENIGEPREIKVTIKPKETDKYLEVVWEFCLKQLDQTDSPEFQGDITSSGRFEPKIMRGLEWYDGKVHNYHDDYGSKAITLTVLTVSKEASVYYQIVGLDGKAYNGAEEKKMTNNGDTSHKSDRIVLFEDKPTNIKVWVVSRTGKRRNDDRGVWNFTLNPVRVKWGYSFMDDPNKFQKANYNDGYDVIKIDRNKVKNGKLYVSFGIWDVYEMGKEGLAPEQKPFTKMKMYDDDIQIQWYTHEVNISQLMDDNKESLEIMLPILENGVPCFTYKITLRLE